MYKRIFITAIVMLLAIAAFAQKGLNIAKFFNDDFLSKSGISSVNISGA